MEELLQNWTFTLIIYKALYEVGRDTFTKIGDIKINIMDLAIKQYIPWSVSTDVQASLMTKTKSPLVQAG